MNDAILIEAQPQAEPYGLFRLLLSLLGIFALAIGLLVALMGLFALFDGLLFGWADVAGRFDVIGRDSVDQLVMAGLIIGSAAYVAISIAVFLMARRVAGAGWRGLLGWTPFRTDAFFWRLLLVAVAYQMAAGALIRFIEPNARNWLIFPEGPLGMSSAFALVVIFGPICEELLFRGWIYTALRLRYGFRPALWTTTVLFALVHWEATHLYALAILPMGLLLGCLRERTGSTQATILFHALYNFAGLAVSFLGKL